MPPSPPGPLRVVLLLARVAARRWWNRVRAQMQRKKAAAPGAPREGTARKGGKGAVGVVFLGVLFLFYGVMFSSSFVSRIGAALDRGSTAPGIPMPASLYRMLEEKERALKELRLDEPTDSDATRRAKEMSRGQILVDAMTRFSLYLMRKDLTEEERKKRVNEWMEAFEAHGVSAFRETREAGTAFWPSRDHWPRGREEPLAVRMVGLLLLFLGVAEILLAFGTGNTDLGRVEWSLEWLFTLPASATALFAAKVFEYAVVSPFIWLMTFPFLFSSLWSAGYDGWAVAVGLMGTISIAATVGSVRLVGETYLRTALPPNRLKNMQAVLTLVGTLMLFAVYWIAFSPEIPTVFVRAAMATPAWALWLPLSLPAFLCGKSVGAAAGVVAAMALVPAAAVLLARHRVRSGLLSSSAVYEGKRGRPGVDSGGGGLRGVIGKELRLLLRDRNFLVQTLVVPVLIVGFNLIMNPSLRKGIGGDPRHVATLAFSVGAYVLMFSAVHVLATEGSTLWLLFTFPVRLHRILVEKAAMWCCFATLYTATILAVSVGMRPEFDWEMVSVSVTAIVGIGIYTFIAAGLGALGTDPLEHEVKRKVRPDVLYFYMLLAGMFAFAIYTPSVWGRIVQVLLSAATAFGLWQKVGDRLPYLLDPTEAPPPRIDVGDGLMAALVFFVLQGMAAMLLGLADVAGGTVLLLSFVLAGLATTLSTLAVFREKRVPDVLATVGLRRTTVPPIQQMELPPEHRIGFGWLGVGALAGAAAASFGSIYLLGLKEFPALRSFFGAEALATPPEWWLLLLAIFAAPIFEEFIFRGLLHQGLRRSVRPWCAALASAALFAIVHPPASALPVFGLGLATAIAFERTRLLHAPMVAHAIYNAVVLWLQAR